MARRRYLSTEAGRDKRLSSVSPTAALCYLLSIPHGDHCGRLPGDPFEYACEVAAGRRMDEEEATAVIGELVKSGLYIAYSSNGTPVLAFPAKSWLEHQGRALNEASRPEQPSPPEGVTGVLPDRFDLEEECKRHGVVLGTRRKSAEVCGKEPNSADPPPPSLSPPPPLSPKKKRPASASAADAPRSSHPLDWYVNTHRERHPEAVYEMPWVATAANCKKMEDKHGKEKLHDLFTVFLETPRHQDANWSPQRFFQGWVLTELFAKNGGANNGGGQHGDYIGYLDPEPEEEVTR